MATSFLPSFLPSFLNPAAVDSGLNRRKGRLATWRQVAHSAHTITHYGSGQYTAVFPCLGCWGNFYASLLFEISHCFDVVVLHVCYLIASFFFSIALFLHISGYTKSKDCFVTPLFSDRSRHTLTQRAHAYTHTHTHGGAGDHAKCADTNMLRHPRQYEKDTYKLCWQFYIGCACFLPWLLP